MLLPSASDGQQQQWQRLDSPSPFCMDLSTGLTAEEEGACDRMMAELTHQVLEERLAEVVTPSPGPASPKARPVLESANTLDVLQGAVMETYNPAEPSRRFTSRLRPKAGYASDQGAQPRPAPRPGRLGGAVEGAGSDPIFERSMDGAESKEKRPVPSKACPLAFQDLPAFRHLALLEEAVGSGKELPLLPQELPSPAAGRLAPMTGSAAAAAASLTLQAAAPAGLLALQPGGADEGFSFTPRSQLLKASGAKEEATARGSQAFAHASPRVLVPPGGSSWGLQAPLQGTLRRPAGNAAPLGFNKSSLRGTGITRKGCGAAATALWISTETQRLRKEYAQKTSLGASYAAAFLVNDGPEHMLGGTPLSARLTREQPAR